MSVVVVVVFDRGVPFVDVRSIPSWNRGHIPGAVLLDYKTDFSEANLLAVIGKEQEAVIYCEGPKCLRSSKASAKAVSWGFDKIRYFRDGFPGWKAAGDPIEAPSEYRFAQENLETRKRRTPHSEALGVRT